MDIQFYGANCLVFSNKQNRLVIDDNLTSLGAKGITKDGDICLFTASHGNVAVKARLVIDMPGEYEVSNISVTGIQTRAHMDDDSKETAVMYKISWGESRLLVTGHIFPKLSEEQLEAVGMVDIMFVPVGGNGYTLDATGALQLIKAIEPKLVVPTHYASPGIAYEVPQVDLSSALQNLGMEVTETVNKMQVKPTELADTTRLVVLEVVK